MRYTGFALALALLLGLPACGAGGGQTNGTSSPQPTEAITGASAGATSPEASSEPAGTPAAAPAPSADPNLLSVANGTILRSYAPANLDGMNDGSLGNAANGIGSALPSGAQPPYVFTFELAGVGTISGVAADLRGATDTVKTPSVTFAVSTTSATAGFKDIATLNRTADGNPSPQPISATARWVRVTANQLFDSVSATGSIAPPPRSIDPTGIFIQDARPDKNGGLVMSGISDGDDRARFVAVAPSLSATECTQSALLATYAGSFHGRTWTAVSSGNKDRNPDNFTGSIDDEGTVFAGVNSSGNPTYFLRTSEKPAFCQARVSGTGLHHVLVLDQDPMGTFYPADPGSAPALAGYTFSAIAAGMLDADALSGMDTVITRGVCYLPKLLAPDQMQLLLRWVSAGHKLILGGGGCGTGVDFTWLQYPFTSPGPGPESTKASLIQVENNALGTSDKNDAAHNVDVATLVLDPNNDLPNAVLMTTTDPHWCGHYFVAKTTNLNGFAQSYAVVGSGLVIYDGFNGDESATMQRIRQLEMALAVPAGLPCSQLVTEAFVLEPSQEAAFSAGSAQTLHVPMEILANQGWNGHVTVKTSGDLTATVTPAAFDIAGGTQVLSVNIPISASTKPGVYTVGVSADNGSGKTASASVTLTGTASLKKQFTPAQKRIRIYGIHFDVDSAHIQPRSEPVIAQIADIMHENAGLRFQVEGHTDSDGGATYNLALSQRRAQAVVDDLVNRYRIARSRLVAKGFGLTKPVASNATDAGKALNRRVELLRL